MSFIEVKQISKTFRVAKKKSGLKEAFKSFVKRKYLNVKAVEDISFTIEKGEIVGIIDENSLFSKISCEGKCCHSKYNVAFISFI